MPLNIATRKSNQLAEKLAAHKHINKTEAVKLALENELRRLDEALPLRERLRRLQDRVLARPATGLKADKGTREIRVILYAKADSFCATALADELSVEDILAIEHDVIPLGWG